MAKHKLNDNDRAQTISPKHLQALLSIPGRHADGNGLYLQVASPGQGSWMSRVAERWKSVGPVDEVSPDTARRLHEARKAEYQGTAGAIPAAFGTGSETRPAPALADVAGEAPARRERFAAVLEAYLALNIPKWKVSNRDREARNYRKLAKTDLGLKWADDITTADVEAALLGTWGHALASADKARMRLKLVLDYARAKGYRPPHAVNPANKDDMRHLIANPPKSKPHPAMKLPEVPAFVAELIAEGSPQARALAFLIMTASRTQEARDVDWSEIRGNVWHVPGGELGRMKEKIEHEVPLSRAALALLGKPKKSGKVFGDLAHDALIERLKLKSDTTVHGLRSVFIGWCVKNGYSKDLRDRAIAHAVGDANAQAYDREKLLEERREMMDKWSEFLMAR